MTHAVIRYAISTDVDCSAQAAWAHVSSVEGIAAELAPVLRMTFPPEITELDETSVPLHQRLCRSWILLGGVLPIEYDDVTLVELEPGRRFLEASQTLTLSHWGHERIVEARGSKARITDRLSAIPRLPLPPALIRTIVAALFQHRHRRLREILGGGPSSEVG